MMTLLQVQAYRGTGQIEYLDRVALTMMTYLDSARGTSTFTLVPQRIVLL